MLYLCSKSTERYVPKNKLRKVITMPAQKCVLAGIENSSDKVVAIGGGAVIDVAKIIAKDFLTVYPTTAAGSAFTSHSVYWEGITKYSIKGRMPDVVKINTEMLKSVPTQILQYSYYDAVAHCLESLWSKDSTEESDYYALEALEYLKSITDFSLENRFRLVYAGNIAGKAIEIAKTNLMHSLSYPMTSIYKIPHGQALGILISKVACQLPYYSDMFMSHSYKFDRRYVKKIVNEGMKYDKMFNVRQKINEHDLMRLLRK